MAVPLLSVTAPARRLIGDKAYDADSLRRWLAERRIKAVIPSTASRRTPYPLSKRIYRRRNVIERLFCRLKNWRRIATIRPTCQQLPRRHRSRRHRGRMDQMSPQPSLKTAPTSRRPLSMDRAAAAAFARSNPP